jgi:hypothetical protein
MTVAVVWAHMHTPSRRHGPPPRALSLVLAVLVVAAVAACGSVAAPPTSEAPDSPPATLAPSQDPSGSIGIVEPAPSEDPVVIDPLGRIVVPKPGQLDVRPIPAQTLSAATAGRRATLTIDYTSGIEPCNILDSIVVAVDAKAFAITLREGHGPQQDVVCIEIAESKRAIVDLGELAPGAYTISDTTGGATPITVTVD